MWGHGYTTPDREEVGESRCTMAFALCITKQAQLKAASHLPHPPRWVLERVLATQLKSSRERPKCQLRTTQHVGHTAGLSPLGQSWRRG